jgi:hypothetical protein
MRNSMAVLFAVLLVPSSHAASSANNVGFYHWGGQHTTSMNEGVERIAQLGGRMARVVLAPAYYQDYNIGQGCYPGYSLSALAHEADVKRALDNVSVDVLMLTAYDGTTFGDCEHARFLNPSFYTAVNTAALSQEYSDFTLYLYRTYRHTHKSFIVSDWESDNFIYCPDNVGAYAYATDPSARAECDASYAAIYGNSSPAESIQGLTLWYQARQQGIADGRHRAEAEGMREMRVYFAPEFCSMHALHNAGFPSVLYDVLPAVTFDYVSYSAYESINAADPATTLTADLNTIQDAIGSSAFIIGETGFSRSFWGGQVVPRTDAVVSAAQAWGVIHIIQWNLYDQNSQTDFGLFDLDGNATPLGAYFQDMMSGEPVKGPVFRTEALDR